MIMQRSRVLNLSTCWVVLLAFTLLSLVPTSGRAALMGSRLSGGESISERTERIETIRQALEHELVRQKLTDFGLSAQEVSAKLERFSDEQLHQLAGLSHDLAAGGILEGIIAVLLIVLLVVVILKISGKQIIIR